MQIVRFVDEQDDGLAAASEQFLQIALAAFALLGDLRILVRGEVVEQGRY